MQISHTISPSRIPSLLFPPKSTPKPLQRIQLSFPSPRISVDDIRRPSAVKRSGLLSAIEEEEYRKARAEASRKKGLEVGGHHIEGSSIGGLETCVVVPTLNAAFGIGRCAIAAVHQDFLFIAHARADHIVSSHIQTYT